MARQDNALEGSIGRETNLYHHYKEESNENETERKGEQRRDSEAIQVPQGKIKREQNLYIAY